MYSSPGRSAFSDKGSEQACVSLRTAGRPHLRQTARSSKKKQDKRCAGQKRGAPLSSHVHAGDHTLSDGGLRYIKGWMDGDGWFKTLENKQRFPPNLSWFKSMLHALSQDLIILGEHTRGTWHGEETADRAVWTHRLWTP